MMFPIVTISQLRLKKGEEAKAAFRAVIKMAPESEYGIKAKKSLEAITLEH